MMYGEFGINRNIYTGSEGYTETLYWLYFIKREVDVEAMSLDELVRLHDFLGKYLEDLKKEGGAE